jgi:hypothetical protein
LTDSENSGGSKEEHGQQNCERCKAHQAYFHCAECDVYLCQECNSIVHDHGIFAKHDVEELPDPHAVFGGVGQGEPHTLFDPDNPVEHSKGSLNDSFDASPTKNMIPLINKSSHLSNDSDGF